MLINKRYEEILNFLKINNFASVQDLCDYLNVSEATIRRDITWLDKEKKLNKVFGGAMYIQDNSFSGYESNILEKSKLNVSEKEAIASYAVSLLEENDFIYIDSGTTTGFMVDFIKNINITVVTNGIEIAKRLTAKNINTILLSGNIKLKTDAIVGSEAIDNLKRFNFLKGFFGTNGITAKQGYTTPDLVEACTKACAVNHCKNVYILADSSKFEKIYPVTFADINQASIITQDFNHNKIKKYTKIIQV